MKPKSELILYQTEDNRTRIEVRLENETVWLTLNQLAELFQRDKSVISKHIRNIFEEGELHPKATVAKNATVQTEGARAVSRELEFFNLDVIIAVGYRVKSHRGTQFRQWATQRLREYIVKGFTMDDERLKNPPGKGQKDYFDELLQRIRDIRSSERRFYQKVLDIYATSIDYDPGGEGLSEHTAPFDALVQVLEGEAEIMVSGQPHRVQGGEMILLPAGQPHALKAIKRFKMMLTMIRSLK